LCCLACDLFSVSFFRPNLSGEMAVACLTRSLYQNTAEAEYVHDHANWLENRSFVPKHANGDHLDTRGPEAGDDSHNYPIESNFSCRP
jgi:hypothetical protein